jgi:hypothetical protein
MTAMQLKEWMVFDLIEPFGPERADARTGDIVLTLMNANRDRKRRPHPFELDDAVLMFGDSKRRARVKDWRAMKAISREAIRRSEGA